MEDYKEMYYMLFNKVTDTISELQAVQMKTEQLIIASESKQNTDNRIQRKNDCFSLRNKDGRKML